MSEQERPKIVEIERGRTIRIKRGIERTLREMAEIEGLMSETDEQLRIAMKLNSQGVNNDEEIELLLDELHLMEKNWDALQHHVEKGTALLDEMLKNVEAFIKKKEEKAPEE